MFKDCWGADIRRHLCHWVTGAYLGKSLLTVKEREVVGAVSKMWVFRQAKINGTEFQSSFYK